MAGFCYRNGQTDTDHAQQKIEANAAAFARAFGPGLTEIDIKMRGSGNSNVTSRNTRTAVTRREELAQYTDVIVDVSAMPRTVGLTAIAQLIALLDELAQKGGPSVNLHVAVAESVTSDRRHTSGSLSETVMSLVGFSGQLTSESTANIPRVWFPVLGEGQAARLERIRAELDPDEICPVIPFPSRDPRRGDRLIEEYRQLLFDDFRVEPTNILYASDTTLLRRIASSTVLLTGTGTPSAILAGARCSSRLYPASSCQLGRYWPAMITVRTQAELTG